MKDKIKKFISDGGHVVLVYMGENGIADIMLSYSQGLYETCQMEGGLATPYAHDTNFPLDEEFLNGLQDADDYDVETFFAGLTYLSLQEFGNPMYYILDGKLRSCFLRKPLKGNTVL